MGDVRTHREHQLGHDFPNPNTCLLSSEKISAILPHPTNTQRTKKPTIIPHKTKQKQNLRKPPLEHDPSKSPRTNKHPILPRHTLIFIRILHTKPRILLTNLPIRSISSSHIEGALSTFRTGAQVMIILQVIRDCKNSHELFALHVFRAVIMLVFSIEEWEEEKEEKTYKITIGGSFLP